MKKLALAVTLLLAGASQAHAGLFYDLFVGASSSTLRVGLQSTNRNDAVFTSSGAVVIQSTSSTSGYSPLRVLNYAGSEILKLTQAGALTVSSFIGNLTGNVTGNLTGNVTGNVTGALTGNADTATSATTATNLAAGGVGQHPYQSASGATAFLPAMGSGGIIVGNGTSAIPSTATLQGTASQVTVTKSGTAVTLSLPNPINVATSGNAATATALATNGTNCSSGNYPLGVDASGNAEGCTAAGGGDVSSTGSNSFNTAGTNQTFGSSVTVNGQMFVQDRSTFTLISAVTPGSAASNVGIATVTYTVQLGVPFWINAVGSYAWHNNNEPTKIAVLIDGAYPFTWSASSPITSVVQHSATSSYAQNASFNYYVDVSSVASIGAGSHRFTLVISCPGSAGTCASVQNGKPTFGIIPKN